MFSLKNPLKNVPCANIQIFWLCVVIELTSSNWKVIATCANSYITDVFFSCKRVINELIRTDITANRQVHINTHADRK